jgi:hypothetical protein
MGLHVARVLASELQQKDSSYSYRFLGSKRLKYFLKKREAGFNHFPHYF